MADLTRTVEVIFGAVDETGPGLTSIGDSINEMNDSLLKVADPFAELADKILKFDAVVAGLAATFTTVAVVAAVKFQNAQIDLNKVLSEGDQPIDSFTKSVTELSEQYGVSAATILQGTANFKQAGFTAEESAKLQKNALDLVIAGDIDATLASELLVSSLKGMGAEASDASRFIEAMNNVSNDYATDVQQLAEGLSRVAPILDVMGFSFEEGAGLITPMIEVFGSGSIAADALKTGLLKLIDDAKPVTTALQALGVSQTDLNGQMRSGKDIFYDVANAFQSVDENQKLVFASQLFGIEQAPKLVAVFNDIAKVNEITASAMEKTGSVTNEVNLRLESAGKQIDKFVVGFENLSRVIGTQILDQFSEVVGGATDLENAFRNIIETGGLDPIFDALRTQMIGFDELITGIAKALPEAFNSVDFSGLIDAFGSLGDSVSGIFNGIDLSQPEDLSRVIQTIVDSFTSLINTTSGIIDAWSPVIKLFTALLTEFNKLDPVTQQIIGSVLGASQVFTTFSPILGGVGTAISTLGTSFSTLSGLLSGGAFAGLFTGVGAAATVAAGALGYGVGTGLSWGIDEVISKNTDSHHTLGTYIADLFGVGDEAGRAATSILILDEATSAANVAAREHAATIADAAVSSEDWTAAVDQVSSSIVGVADKTDLYNAAIARANDTTLTAEQRDLARAAAIQLQEDILLEATETQSDYNQKLIEAEKSGQAYTTYWDGSKQAIKIWTDTTEDATKAVEKTLNAQGKLTEAQKLAIENAQELTIELEKLASNERIKSMEFKVELDIEKVKAAAQVMNSILDSTTAFFDSSGDVITSLVQGLTEAFGFREKEFFKEQIEAEMNLRQQEIDLQYEVLASQERMFQTQLDLNREGLSVKIAAEGLDADLEKVMITILNRIRTSITGDYTQFLLASSA